MLHQTEFTEIMQRASHEGITLLAHPTPYDSVALFLTPKMAGYSALNVADLTEVEFPVSRHDTEFQPAPAPSKPWPPMEKRSPRKD